jgi:hypothetical protein
LLFPEAGVPWIRILLGFRPLELLNSPTTNPILLIKPDLHFQFDIVGNDDWSIKMSPEKISKLGYRKPSSIGTSAVSPLPMVFEIAYTISLWETWL